MHNHANNLLSDDCPLRLTQRSLANFSFALPERAEHHSGFLPRLKKARCREPKRDYQDQPRRPRRSYGQHDAIRYDGNSEPLNSLAPSSSCSTRADVGDTLGHVLSRPAGRELSTRLGGVREQPARGTRVGDEMRAVASYAIALRKPGVNPVTPRIE